MKCRNKSEEKMMKQEKDILFSERFFKAWEVRHHYNTSVADHSERTAAYAMRICSWRCGSITGSCTPPGRSV